MSFFRPIKPIFIVVLALCFLCGCFRSREAERTRAVQTILDALSQEELATLDSFFRTLMGESQGGYVLYGQKPVCVEAFPLREEGSIFLARPVHIFSTKLKPGALLWKRLHLNQYCQNYALCVSDQPIFDKWSEIAFINKKAFVRT
ncbi:MAG: hypothetical protein KGI83_06705, partial [Verrucomicrobiota bacterium]|nr:hypothetical protein [Verrucomicrobiota bacterium]